MKRILLYTGYQQTPFDSNTKIGLGGTEQATIHISKELVKFGYKVVVSGQVLNSGIIDGVEWIDTVNLHKKYHDQFDVIIGISYIHFVLEFEKYNATKIFWVHNTDYFEWFNGKRLENSQDLLNKIDKLVCLTDWHKNNFIDLFKPSCEIKVIGNGIDFDTFVGKPLKVKDRFIWSSAGDRGLFDLLDNWNNIRRSKPHATLSLFYPSYAAYLREDIDKKIHDLNLKGITVYGNVNPEELHYHMLRSEFWCYLTDYEETYCITALEMQAARVLPITTTVAALNETVHSGIILNNDETKWNTAIEILNKLGPELMKKSLDTSSSWVKRQTWNSRSYDWKNLIDSIK